MNGSVSKAQDPMEMVSSLSKEELLELIRGSWRLVDLLNPQRIKDARARVLRKKADEAYKQWEAIANMKCPPINSLEDYETFMRNHKEGEAQYKRYRTLWDRADKLEFGKGGLTMATPQQLAKIHIAKKDLALGDDAYRDILRLHFQVESAKALTERQATVLLNQFRAKGWEVKQGQRAAKPSGRPGYIEVKPGPAAKQQRKVLALWHGLGYEMAKLHTRVKTQFGVDRFEWLDDSQALHVLITDLECRTRKLTAQKRAR